MEKKGIGIIGLAHWYWAYGCAYSIAMSPIAELAAICDIAEERARKMAEVYGAKRYYKNYEELLRDPEVEAVIITASTDMHDEVALAAARAGKDILIGKPISRTLQGAERTIKEVEKAGVKLMAMATGPSQGDRIKKLIDEGVIGKPYVVHSSLLATPPLCEPGLNKPGWFADPQKAPGGGFIDHAIYAVGKLRWYFASEVKRVYAEMGKFVYKDWEVEDHGMAILKFENGAIATLEATFTAPDRTHGGMMIIGTEGEIELKGNMISIWSKKEPYKERQSFEMLPPNPVYDKIFAEVAIPTPPYVAGYKPTVDEFIDYITTGKEPMGTPEDAKISLEVCLAAYESVRIGGVVELPLKSEVDVATILKSL